MSRKAAAVVWAASAIDSAKGSTAAGSGAGLDTGGAPCGRVSGFPAPGLGGPGARGGTPVTAPGVLGPRPAAADVRVVRGGPGFSGGAPAAAAASRSSRPASAAFA
ncbi:hypothetical protein GCM10009787_55260 [Streptomyces bangladeshensis]|uniref:Uncharacterized protein n=1 Tax=Streptomyces bangladeshensis TaxID=295352 RepID=A0ABN3BX53_9ACTN